MDLENEFSKSVYCPNCKKILSKMPSRKEKCPHCGEIIRVRNRTLITEEDSQIYDWLMRLEYLGITKKDFDDQREELSKEFGIRASVNDTIWRILNSLVVIHVNNDIKLEYVYRQMAALVAKEGKDPTRLLVQAEDARKGRPSKIELSGDEKVFLGHDELRYVKRLRMNGDFKKVEELLMKAKLSPAVMDEVRKLSSAKAKIAKKKGDWVSVVEYLSGYMEYADKLCKRFVSQGPPEHTKTDLKLLAEAKSKLEDV